MKRLFAAAMVAFLALGLAGQAAAVPLNVTPPGPSVALNIGDTGDFGQIITVSQGSTAFTTTFQFTVTDTSQISTGFIASIGAISGLVLKLLDVTNTVTLLTTGPGSFSYLGSLVTGIQYAIEVSGTAGAPIGSYVGSISIAAIPLPAALPLLGAGLVALGAFARRRRQNASA